MSGNDQERFADYLDLDNYIEDLQAERAAHLPANLTVEHVRLYRMAALFHSVSSPAIVQPRPEFISSLQEHLLSIDTSLPVPTEVLAQAQQTDQQHHQDQHMFIHQPMLAANSQETVQSLPASPQEQPEIVPAPPLRRVRVSRRTLLTGGAAAAASLAVGVGIGESLANQPPSQPQVGASVNQENLDPSGPTKWLFVATLAQLSQQAVKFATNATAGYVVLNDPNNQQSITAVLATCTHMGCLVNWQKNDRQFLCPCHGGLFDEHGMPADNSPLAYLKPLPRLKTKLEDGKVYVQVPIGDGSSA